MQLRVDDFRSARGDTPTDKKFELSILEVLSYFFYRDQLFLASNLPIYTTCNVPYKWVRKILHISGYEFQTKKLIFSFELSIHGNCIFLKFNFFIVSEDLWFFSLAQCLVC